MKHLACCLVGMVLASQATVAGAQYADHPAVTMFSDAPCATVIQTVDGDTPDLESEESLDEYLGRLAEDVAFQGMAWGFILGFDTARGGLESASLTTLERLREGCAASPESTALEILEALD